VLILFSSGTYEPQHHAAEGVSPSSSASAAARQDTSIYIGFKRIPFDDAISHTDLLLLMKPGNAAIIFQVLPAYINQDNRIVAPVGHYTCAWKEEESDNVEEDGYFYYDSKIQDVTYCVGSKCRRVFDYQKAGKIRALFLFKLPLQLPERQAAIKGALANLSARVNGILEHCFSLKEFDVSLPVNFF